MDLEEKKEEIFAAAIEFEDRAERTAYLARACGADRDLLEKVQGLLRRHDASSFLDLPPLETATDIEIATVTETPGTVIGRYKLLERIGEGGMAVVYMAEQEQPIRRKVALKIIKLGMDTRQVIARFEAERQALAMMDHPNIAKVLDAGATETGRPYFVMELVQGVSITEYCDANNLSTSDRLGLFVQVCNAVQHAHQKGIIHRDIKPSNVMVAQRDGAAVPKVIDFGIAKAMNQRLTEKTLFTRYAHIIGTPAYMSPEQAELSDLDIDTRTDIYSLGVLLYELLTGTTPFSEEELRKAGYTEMQRVIREQEPVKPSTRIRTSQVGQLPWRGRPALARRGHPARDADSGRARDNEQGQDALATGRCTPYQQVRGDLDWIVMKALEKTRDRRYDNASALAMDVQRHLKNEPILAGSPGMFCRLQKFVRRHRSHLATATVVTVLAVGLVITAVKYRRTSRLAWAKGEALPRIVELVEAGEIAPAFALVQKVQKVIPNDPTLIDLWPRISKAYSIDTTPPGVRVFYREYADQNGPWRSLGQSPLRIILANGIYRWKLEKQGFNTHECVTDRSLSVRLCPSDLAREMVWIEGWKIDSWHAELLRDSFAHGTIAEVPAFLMDKYEVTNEQFQAFVDAGGYTNAEYWEGLAFIKDDRQLPWQEAMAKFRDQTGQPGPATWEHGTYPQGRERHPVSGVGWFEAMAYARFSGKSLPTLYHWRAAACTEESTVIVPHSNFNTGGTAVVGSFPGTGHTGLYDMAGNVKEWCFNATDDSGSQHVIKGASYAEQTYNFTGVELRSPWNRSPVNGFRCVKYPEGDIHSFAEGLLAPVPLGSPERDYSTSEPCSDEEYRFILRQFEYDRLPLDANVVRVDDSAPLWREETITFNATYGREQVIAHLFLPKAVEPPYQVVVYWPDNRALEKRPFIGLEQTDFTEMILQSGRALMFPVYQGTYERSYGQYLDWFTEPHATADWIIHVCQDMCRSIDYLETRHDIDEKKIAYYGVCVGGICGPMALVIEDRFKTGILVGGGFPNAEVTAATPAIDPLHHAPRVKTPVLMINSEQDPLAVSQLPMYRFLGTPDEHKRYNVYPDGSSNGDDFRRDVAGWLDRYLGPVE